MKKLFMSEKGWIFIDSILGIVILVVAILALAGTYIMSAKSNTYAKNYGQALAIAQQYAENHKVSDSTFTTETHGIFTVKPIINVATNDNLGKSITPVEIVVDWHEQSGDKHISIVNYYYAN
ncbi:hypothetical protein [Pelosinus sp. UFO1]|uniref:type IV pilus modification PilV family protein n=1 Tax=Pelosinus sp. UFO1 TaxID=484770 RepID=UPI0004D10E7C|nr:hypothetical protein [Pelosinus sp. UFO1]AIF51328.1 hypothetical protein UFO1_1777 [Pelosinus sp. UFO1]